MAEELGFTIELRGDVHVIVWTGDGCRPATEPEVEMWQALRAQLPSQGGEAVEVVASIAVDAEGVVQDFTLEPGLDRHHGGYTVTPLMTVAQHRRILAAATHPADQVADDLTMVKVSRELLEQIAVELEHDSDRYFLGRELRALLNGGRS